MSPDSAVLGGAVTKRQVWMDGWMEGSISHSRASRGNLFVQGNGQDSRRKMR